jgi:hypothetical protein
MKLGHEGLFLDRLDLDSLSPGTGSVWPTLLAPFSEPFYQMRNRDYRPQWGRFVQRDPNQTGQPVLMGSYHGQALTAPDISFSLEALYTDGHNLYQYLGSNPLNGSDPYGLFGIMGGLSTGMGMADMAADTMEQGYQGVSMGLSLQGMLDDYAYMQEADLDWALDWDASDDWLNPIGGGGEEYDDGTQGHAFAAAGKGPGKGLGGSKRRNLKPGSISLSNVRKIEASSIRGPPPKRGNAPIGTDGHPIEIHHVDGPNGPFREVTKTQHASLPTKQKLTRAERDLFNSARRDYWRRQWDSGRW